MTEIVVPLPDDLKFRAEQAARQNGIALDQFVRQCVESTINKTRRSDPLFADLAVFDGETPPDLSARHDDYLYGEGQ